MALTGKTHRPIGGGLCLLTRVAVRRSMSGIGVPSFRNKDSIEIGIYENARLSLDVESFRVFRLVAAPDLLDPIKRLV